MFTKLDYNRKMSETDTHVYFVGGPFSQWAKSSFVQHLIDLPDLYRFNCCEQYMMASKAVLFDDMAALEAIMLSTSPSEQKSLGRTVKNFDPQIWNDRARDIVFLGNIAKFGQNPDLWDELNATGEKYLVEGAHYDPVWGVKLAWNDPLILDEKNWRGTNWLGEVLMRVRRYLREPSQ